MEEKEIIILEIKQYRIVLNLIHKVINEPNLKDELLRDMITDNADFVHSKILKLKDRLKQLD